MAWLKYEKASREWSKYNKAVTNWSVSSKRFTANNLSLQSGDLLVTQVGSYLVLEHYPTTDWTIIQK